jgi:hypothetical protein
MDWFTFSIIATIAVLWLVAGHQTWWRLLLEDPDASDCSIAASIRDGTLPPWVYSTFILFWPVFLFAGWVQNLLNPEPA